MCRDAGLAETFREVSGDALDEPSRVDEDDRRPVDSGQGGKPLVDLRPDLAGHHRSQRRGRQFQRQIEIA